MASTQENNENTVGSQRRRQAGEMDNPDGSGASPNKKNKYAEDYPRISKYNIFMLLALWMEDFVDETTEKGTTKKGTTKKGTTNETPYNKVGAVMVLPNDLVLAADCSRGGVHAVARLLMQHHNKTEGCKMFVSRKPCPICAKLLVQSKVKRVLFLPVEPEYYRWPKPSDTEDEKRKINEDNETQMKQVDILFTASSIAQTKFILRVEESVLKRKKDLTPQIHQKKVDEKIEELIEKYEVFKENSDWTRIEFDTKRKEKPSLIEKHLPWPAFDKNMGDRLRENFQNVMEWIARVLVQQGRGLTYDFERVLPEEPQPEPTFNPVHNPTDKEQAKHFITIARFLAERTDDPKTGVGAVIVNPKMKFISLGWNGFPLKAEYGEFARASETDRSTNKKYPYVIHAEQNALLMRNQQNIEGSILFLTRSPCNECTPLIEMAGIKTVVVDDNVSLRDNQNTAANALDYKMFPNKVKKGEIVCYQLKKLRRSPRKAPGGTTT